MKEEFPVTIVGSVAYDNIMKFPGVFKKQLLQEQLSTINTCFVVDTRSIHYGGTAANLAIGFKTLGINSLILSKVGEDIDDYITYLEKQNITTQGLEIAEKEKTLFVLVTTDEEENQITIVHPGAFARMNELSLKKHNLPSKGTQLVILNPLIGEQTKIFADQCLELGIPYVFDPGQNIQTISKEHLIYNAQNAKYSIFNEYEFSLFSKITELSPTQSAALSDIVIVTQGSQGSVVYEKGKPKSTPVVKPKQIRDPTGAGDAYRAGFFSGILRGFPMQTCAQMGALAGTYCIEVDGPQNKDYTYSDFERRYEKEWKTPIQ